MTSILFSFFTFFFIIITQTLIYVITVEDFSSIQHVSLNHKPSSEILEHVRAINKNA